jgi:hypothetical protein
LGDGRDKHKAEDDIMRDWPFIVVSGVFAAGCFGKSIDAGGNGDAGTSTPSSTPGGQMTIASQIQETPTNLASDGTTLFWTSSVGAGGAVSSMSVGGGPITTVVPAPVEGGFLAVDDLNVYFPGQSGIYRAPKSGGGTPTIVNEAGASISGMTVLGSSAYWVESPIGGTIAVKTAPLKGGAVSTIAEFNSSGPQSGSIIGVTTTTVFLSGFGTQLASFPISSGVPDGGMPATVPGNMQECQLLVSDTDTVYCDTDSSINRVASDGTTTVLGMVIVEGTVGDGLAFDDTYVYWVDSTTVGTVMRVPKTGGTATIIARDTNPVAIAVDANAIYWSDVGGSIMRLPK